MIPKRIFYVWGAGEKKRRDVQVCIQTWRQTMPDYEIVELNEDDKTYFDYEKEIQENKWFRTVYENKLWAYVADYIRIKVLHDHGGIYFDTDVSAVKPLDKFLSDECFVGMQDENYVEPAILGAQKGNAFLKKVLDFYNDGIWKLPIFTMPQIFQHFLTGEYSVNAFPDKPNQKVMKLKDITIYPERFFIPFRYKGEFTPECIEKDTHTIHWFGGSWLKPEVIDWLMNKHINPDTKLLKIERPFANKRFCLFGRTTVLKIAKYKTKSIVYFLHIPIFTADENKGIYLFKYLRLFKAKKEKKEI